MKPNPANSRTKLIQDAALPSPMYTNLVNGTVGICRQEGLGGIYRGLWPTVSVDNPELRLKADVGRS